MEDKVEKKKIQMSVDTVPLGASFPYGYTGRDTKLGSFQNNQLSYHSANPDYNTIFGVPQRKSPRTLDKKQDFYDASIEERKLPQIRSHSVFQRLGSFRDVGFKSQNIISGVT